MTNRRRTDAPAGRGPKLTLIRGGAGAGRTPRKGRARVISIGGAKGGVGRSTLAANLAVALAASGKRTLLADANFGLGGLDLLLGVGAEAEALADSGGRAFAAPSLVDGPEGVKLLPAGRDLSPSAAARGQGLARSLARLGGDHDFILIDLPPGLPADPADLHAAVDLNLLVLTPEPAALVAGYASAKILAAAGIDQVGLVANRVTGAADAAQLVERFRRVVGRHLKTRPLAFGHLVEDPDVTRSGGLSEPFVRRFPDSPAARCVRRMAGMLLEVPPQFDFAQVLVDRSESPDADPEAGGPVAGGPRNGP